ncbi:hypothetical protein Syun_014931 [Stephania yunnanensis]|uniref:Kinesin motor domain-containing protein n=1 Tax=Stephania yunnanensis TaxID=152371 RepID=A0AAP0JLB6_9MAGN
MSKLYESVIDKMIDGHYCGLKGYNMLGEQAPPDMLACYSDRLSLDQLERNVPTCGQELQVFWPRIVMRKWLNIRNKESDFGADPDEGDAQSDSDDEGSIRVFCRVRPFLITDKRRNQKPICVRSEKLAVSFGGSKKEFGFDKVFPQNASQGFRIDVHALKPDFN